jgi:hypothetical protein
MVVAVPSRPRYLGPARSPARAFFCSCSLTLAVSRGIVVIWERGTPLEAKSRRKNNVSGVILVGE